MAIFISFTGTATSTAKWSFRQSAFLTTSTCFFPAFTVFVCLSPFLAFRTFGFGARIFDYADGSTRDDFGIVDIRIERFMFYGFAWLIGDSLSD